MPAPVRFHFDPICPWCWVTSKWVRQLVRLGEVEADWAVFSLEMINRERAEAAERARRGGHALRTVMLVRDGGGSAAVGRFYEALGNRVHESDERVEDPGTVAGALGDAGLDRGIAAKAAGDDEAWQRVVDEHEALVGGTRSFGVPTIRLDGGAGPAIFGPVISSVPEDADAVALWQHVEWLTRYENFSELKRERTAKPDLPRYRS